MERKAEPTGLQTCAWWWRSGGRRGARLPAQHRAERGLAEGLGLAKPRVFGLEYSSAS